MDAVVIAAVRTRAGASLPGLGLGTWRMGENHARRKDEVAALRLGIEMGLTLVDTAEMYGAGGAERIVAEAVAGRRDRVVLVSKVLPYNASRAGTIAACERSLERLGTDWIDLYLLHWPGPHPLQETLEGFETLRDAGKIRWYGVSNFDVDEMRSCQDLRGGTGIVANQVLYNLERRGIERRLLPWCASQGIAVMAYSPLEQGRLASRRALVRVAERHGATPFQIALAWTLRHENVVSIPKSASLSHVREIVAAGGVALSAEDMEALDADFPVPPRDIPLETA